MAEKNITLADVAERANVAIKTASKVLKNDGTVRSYIRERVMKVADELGYSPNVVAQALRNKTLNLVSCHIAQLDNPFFGKLFEEMAKRLGHFGYLVAPCDGMDIVNETNQRMLACATILCSAPAERIRQVIQDGPVVSVNAIEAQLAIASDVSIDFKWAYRQMAQRLIDADKTNIIYYTPAGEFSTNMSRKFIYIEDVLTQANRQSVYIRERNEFTNPAQIIDYLQQNPGKVNAIVCSNDFSAVRIIDAMYYHKLPFPNEIKVVGCDGTFHVEGMWTISANLTQMAEAVVNLLMKSLKDRNTIPEQVKIMPDILTP